MKCGFCNSTTDPIGRRHTIAGLRMVILVCGSCEAILGAAIDV
jgi:hypothetical protein